MRIYAVPVIEDFVEVKYLNLNKFTWVQRTSEGPFIFLENEIEQQLIYIHNL